MSKKFIDLANLKSNLENFLSEIISPTFATKEGLSNQLGNHTVKSDVPENAVFTDTVYDDTEVQKRISDNGYGEVAGGKNLANPKNFVKNKVVSFDTGYIVNNPDYFVSGYIEVKPNTTYVRQGTSYGSENYSYDENKKPISILGTKFTTSSNTKYVCLSGLKGKENMIMLEEGSVATDYEPYFPSNKMLAEEKADKSETTVNLLNPTLQTTTQNGVTCTNNGDGTYTLNGTSTASSTTAFVIPFSNTFTGKCKLIGCPSGIDSIAELQCNYNGTWSSQNTDHGEGSILDNTNLLTDIAIVILPNVTVNNLVIKPMITTNLDATYDDFVPYTGDSGSLNVDVADIKNDLSKLQDNVDSSDIQYSAYRKNDNGDITPSAITSSPKISEVVSQINNNIGVLLQGHNEQKSKLDNISIDIIDRELGEITFKGINFSAELTLLKIGNHLELLRGKIYTVGSYFDVTSGDVLSFALSVSEFGDYINGLKETSKLAFSAQGIFDSKVIGMIEIGDYISSSGDKGVEVMLRFNDSYDFSSANVRSGTVQFDF